MKMRSELKDLPTGELVDLFYDSGNGNKLVETKKGVLQNNEIISTVSTHYKLITHKNAFKQALEQLEVPEDAKIQCGWHRGKAEMKVFFDELKIDDGKKGIDMAFQIKNSYDGSTALGLSVKRNLFEKGEKYIVFYGMRQVCSNGMKIKIPLSEMNALELDNMTENDVVAEEKQEVKKEELVSIRTSVRHMGDKFEMKYVKLFDFAKNSVPYVEEKIKQAIKKGITEVEFIGLLEELGFRPKAIKGILKRYEKEEENYWGAYNSITAYASHDIKSKIQEEKLIDKAWDLISVPVLVRK